jgi:hypothetical protein
VRKAKFKNNDEFNAVLKKLKPELIERIAQKSDPILISNLDILDEVEGATLL